MRVSSEKASEEKKNSYQYLMRKGSEVFCGYLI